MRAIDIVRRRQARGRTKGHGRRAARAAAIVILLAALAAVFIPLAALGGGAAGLLAFAGDLPNVDDLRALPARYKPAAATTLLYAYDPPGDDGLRRPVLIDEIIDPRRGGAGWLRLSDLPPAVISATLAATDPAYFDRPPLDPVAAAAEWARAGAVTQPVSPLLINLVTTRLLPPPSSTEADSALLPRSPAPLPTDATLELTAKTPQDWFLAWQIEQRFGRDQVLEWTLNTTYYGHLAYGVDAAARVYFGVGAAELTTSQAAVLAAVARDPATNPFDAPDAARAGQAAVLDAMTRHGLLPAAAAARAAPLALAPPPGSDSAAPAFARLARAELERLLGPERLIHGGLQVETTLDPALQDQAACLAVTVAGDSPVGGGPACPTAALLDSVAAPPAALAVVALNPADGTVAALVADADGPPARPIGTLVRPFVALTALSQGYTAASLTFDVERIYLQDGRPYVPPSAGEYRGPLRLREAVAADRPAAAAHMLTWVGVERVLDNARALGLAPANAAPGLAFAERGFTADLLSLGHALMTVGNGGVAVGVVADDESPRPATIRRITDSAGRVVYALAADRRETLSPALAWLLTDMLAGDRTLPDGRRVALVAGAAAETGDGWAIGFTPGQLVGVWAGGAASDTPADAAAAAIWQALMSHSHAGLPAVDWPRPEALRSVEVCALSGLLPQRGAAACPTVREWFAPGTEPTATDTVTREVAINRETGRLATFFTPLNLIERRIYTVYPPEAAAWAEAQGIAAPPTEYDTIRRVPARDRGAAITSPAEWSVVSGHWPVTGSAGGDDFAYYRLAIFPNLLPEAMQLIIERGETPVTAGELGMWDTTLLADGLYTLLLTVVRVDGTFDEVAIPVTVNNGEG